MKTEKFMRTLIILMGLTVATALSVMADSSSNPGGGNQLGNQLTGSQVSWYQRPATVVGPVEGVEAKGGSLLALKAGSVLYMEGNSTLHKYQMHANVLKGSALVKGDLAKALQAGMVDSMVFTVPVNDFKSRESGLDDNAYKALKAKDNPEIKFSLEKETMAAGAKEGTYVLTAGGNLSIAGTAVPVTLSADTTLKDGQVELKGVQKLKMSDYQVKPPSISLLVTSITCSDEIEIHYDVIFAPVGEANSEAKK